MHMTGAEGRSRARTIAEGLNKSFFAHGDAVSRSRARSLQLKIAKNNPKLESLIWQAYIGLESYMEMRSPYSPLQYFIANGGAGVLAPKAPLVLPPNSPPQLINQLWGQVAQEALAGLSQPAVEVPYTYVNAVIESPRVACEFRTTGVLTAARIAGGEINLVATDRQTGWRSVQIPEESDSSNGTATPEGDS